MPRTQSRLAGLDTANEFRSVLAASDPNYVLQTLDACLRPVIYSRHHWLLFKGEYRVRADLRATIESLRPRAPEQWDDDEADLVSTLFALDCSAVGLDELNETADSAAAREVVRARHALYAQVVAPEEEAPTALHDLAPRVAEMRPIVQESHELYSIIDGRAWYRTEGLILRQDIDVRTLTPAVEDVLSVHEGAASGAGACERLRAAAQKVVAADGDSSALVRAMMRAALTDPVLRADHVTLTCPLGDMLDRPQDMTTSGAFFTETQLRDGLDLSQYVERLGHESHDQMHRTIRARMLKLKRGAIRTLYGPGCLQGRFVEKHGGHMIFRNEDAHYRGHQSIGCSSGGRASFALRYPSDGSQRLMTPMVGDFRAVRMTHDERETFTGDELRHLIRYGEWIRVVVEETFRLGAVVRAGEPPAQAV